MCMGYEKIPLIVAGSSNISGLTLITMDDEPTPQEVLDFVLCHCKKACGTNVTVK